MALLGNMVISCLGSGLLWFCFDRLIIVYSVPKPGLNKIHLGNQAYEQDRIRAGKASHLGPEVNVPDLCVDHQR